MRLLRIEVERARDRIGLVRDVLERRLHAVDHGALDLVRVLVEEAVPEHAERGGVGIELLHDQVVVLARFHVAAVLAYRVADRLVLLLVLLLHRLDPVDLLAATLEGELGEGVPRAGGGRRSEDFDLGIGQRCVDVAPSGVRVGDQGFAAVRVRHVLCEREEDLLAGDLDRLGLPGVREYDSVISDFDFDDLVHAVAGALLDLALLDAPRGVGDIGVLDADAGAEQLEAPAGAGGFDLRGLEVGGLAELLRDHGGKWIYGRGADDADVVAGLDLARDGGRDRREDERTLHVRFSWAERIDGVSYLRKREARATGVAMPFLQSASVISAIRDNHRSRT